MNQYVVSLLACVTLFLLMPLMAAWGHRTGRRLRSRDRLADDMSTGVVDAAILSLLGLMTAFTFSSAYSRYDSRRALIIEEVNAISTAWLRLDLLPQESQPALRGLFREYVKSRHELWQLLPSRDAALEKFTQSEDLQRRIWSAAIVATQDETRGDARKLLLPALNQMIDVTTIRLIAVQSHPPLIVFLLLGILSLAAAWIVGFGMSKAERLSHPHVLGFSAMVALALYVILDIEYPRYGLVTLNKPHQLLLELKTGMQTEFRQSQ